MFNPENTNAVIAIVCVAATVASLSLLRLYIERCEICRNLALKLDCAVARETKAAAQLSAVRHQLAKYQERTEDIVQLRWSFMARTEFGIPRLDIFEDGQFIASVPVTLWRDRLGASLDFDRICRLYAHFLPEDSSTTTSDEDSAEDSAAAGASD